MINMSNAIKNIVPISSFNKGLAGKIFEEVKISGTKVVMKNNSAECILLSPAEYLELMDEVNDARLLAIATERIAKNSNSTNWISGDDVFENLGLSSDDLQNFDEVEFE